MSTQTLRDHFLPLYETLRIKLTARLGDRESAEEALHRVYLKLGKGGQSDGVRNPEAYLYRMAVNSAIDSFREGSRLASSIEIEKALHVKDPLSDPHREVEARQELEELADAIADLTPRRKLVLIEARLQGRSCKEIAQMIGVSRRTVEYELRCALDHCRERLSRYATGKLH